MRVYFDNAATTPIAIEVINLMTEMMKSDYANPSSVHHGGRKSKTIIENARKSVASFLNTSPGNIFFTSGGTEADNFRRNKKHFGQILTPATATNFLKYDNLN